MGAYGDTWILRGAFCRGLRESTLLGAPVGSSIREEKAHPALARREWDGPHSETRVIGPGPAGRGDLAAGYDFFEFVERAALRPMAASTSSA